MSSISSVQRNTTRFLLDSGVRIVHVFIRSHCALPFSSLSHPFSPGEDVPRAVIFGLFLRFFVLAYFLQFSASFRLVGRAITLPFRQVQHIVQRATAGATATEIWVKNTTRLLLDSGVRIVHVFIRSHCARPFSSLPSLFLRVKTCRAR